MRQVFLKSIFFLTLGVLGSSAMSSWCWARSHALEPTFQSFFTQGAQVTDQTRLTRQWGTTDIVVQSLRARYHMINKSADFSILPEQSGLNGDVYFIVHPTTLFGMSISVLVHNPRYISLVLRATDDEQVAQLEAWARKSKCSLELFDLFFWLDRLHQPFRGLKQNALDTPHHIIASCGEWPT